MEFPFCKRRANSSLVIRDRPSTCSVFEMMVSCLFLLSWTSFFGFSALNALSFSHTLSHTHTCSPSHRPGSSFCFEGDDVLVCFGIGKIG